MESSERSQRVYDLAARAPVAPGFEPDADPAVWPSRLPLAKLTTGTRGGTARVSAVHAVPAATPRGDVLGIASRKARPIEEGLRKGTRGA